MSQGLTDIKLKNTEAFLKAYMERLETLAKIEINRERKRTYPSGRTVYSPLNSSGSLMDSIESKKQKVSNALMAFGLMGNDYALDINSGTPKSKAPSQAKLVNWIKTKPVQLKNNKGEIIRRTKNNIKEVAIKMQAAQKVHGIAPVPFLEEAAKNSMSHLNGIGLEIAYDITENVEQFLINIGYEEVNGEFKLKEKNNE
jgi:hypothetical protein